MSRPTDQKDKQWVPMYLMRHFGENERDNGQLAPLNAYDKEGEAVAQAEDLLAAHGGEAMVYKAHRRFGAVADEICIDGAPLPQEAQADE